MSASDDYIDLVFYDEDDKSKRFWINLIKCVESVVNLLSLSNFLIASIGMIVNIFHILVLVQKPMRTLTINAFLTGIAVCDFMRMACVVFLSLPLFNLIYFQSTVANECKSPQYYFTMVASNFCASTNNLVQNLSVWYGVTIAVLRAMILRYPLNSRIACFIHTKHGIRPLLIITLILFPFWIISYSQERIIDNGIWYPLSECTNFPPNYSQMSYIYQPITIFGQSDIEFHKIALVLEGTTCKILPCILLPIATILLVLELKKSKLTTATSLSSSKSTKLVIVMTISFFVANFPFGLLYLTEFMVLDTPGLAYITKRMISVFTFLNIANGTVHFIICISMSSQYREVARQLLRMGKVKNSIQDSGASAGHAFNVNSVRYE